MSLLPSGYKRLEYIKSSGTQHVDSGFKPNNNTRVVMDVAIDGHEAGQVWRMNSLNNRDLLGSINSLEIDLVTETASVKLTGVSVARE